MPTTKILYFLLQLLALRFLKILMVNTSKFTSDHTEQLFMKIRF